VFPGPDGGLLQRFIVTQHFKALVRELPDLPQIHFHSLHQQRGASADAIEGLYGTSVTPA